MDVRQSKKPSEQEIFWETAKNSWERAQKLHRPERPVVTMDEIVRLCDLFPSLPNQAPKVCKGAGLCGRCFNERP